MIKRFSLALLFSVAIITAPKAQVSDTIDNTLNYNNCIDAADGSNMKLTECTVNETRRITKLIQEKYNELAQNNYFSQWNYNGISQRNIQQMLNTWERFSAEYCSLYGYAYSQGMGNITELNEAECNLEMAKRHNKDMDAIIKLYQDNSN